VAERRMFAKTIIDSDAFLDMPLSTQSLYFHLSMRADDDGFINNPKKIQRMVGASDDDLKLLIAKNFIIPFESGIVVIKHWKIHNYLRVDRYKATVYQEEKALLNEKDNRAYTLAIPCDNRMDTKCIQDASSVDTNGIPTVYQMDTQVRLGKDSLEEREEEPIYTEVIAYLNEKAGTRYKPTTGKTKSLIHARKAEGFTLEDFQVVIDKKCREWMGTEYEKFLRPETLFGTKFESYLNAKDGVQNGKREGSDGIPAGLGKRY